MTDPVVAGDGHTYQRDVIESWFASKGPVTHAERERERGRERERERRERERDAIESAR